MKETIERKPLIRESGVELLKILAMLGIITNHFCNTATGRAQTLSADYVISCEQSLDNLPYLLIEIIQHFGKIGNNIFFVCSAWFLIGSDKSKFKKVLSIILDVWVLSLLVLAYALIDDRADLNGSTILKCIFPTTFSNNWYTSTYIFFLVLQPTIDKFIQKTEKATHLKIVLVLTFVYVGWDFLLSEWGADLFCKSYITLWIYIYFLLAYLKKYELPKMNNIKLNLLLFSSAVIVYFGSVCLLYLLGCQIDYFKNFFLIWNNTVNPFMLIIAITLLNLFRQIKRLPCGKIINYFSSLTLFMYLYHENLIIRKFYRPLLFVKTIDLRGGGYNNVVLLIFALAFLEFAKASVLAIIYKSSIQRINKSVSDRVFYLLRDFLDRICKKI